jgi:Domain of unknown function DUF11
MGVLVFGSNNIIGGTNPNDRNVLSGNGLSGVYVSENWYSQTGTNNLIQNNFIGTDITGNIAIGNNFSVNGGAIRTDSPNTIIKDNIISGNNNGNTIVVSPTANYTKIIGNNFGRGADGQTVLGNNGSVVYLESDNNIIGGTALGEGNTISNTNVNSPLFVSSTSQNNSILGNSIYENTPNAINLQNIGANDLLDVDTGANNGQNSPVVTSVVTNPSDLTVNGTLNSEANKTYRIELFANQNGTIQKEGKTFLNSVDVTTNASGDATWSSTIPQQYEEYTIASTATEYITSASSTIGTQIASRYYLNTSEFSTFTPSNGADPTITKSHNKPSGTNPGDTVTYTLSYKNKTSNPLTNVVITDTLNNDLQYVANSCVGCTISGQTLTWNIGTIPVGATVYTKTFDVVVNNGTTQSTINNTAQLAASELTNQTSSIDLSTSIITGNNYVVTNNQDNSNVLNDPIIPGSLRDMINQANLHQGIDTIQFNLPNGSTTLDLNWDIDITDSLIIDGSTQPGFSGVPNVEIKGSANEYDGLNLNSDNITIKNLVFNNFRNNLAPAIVSTTEKSAIVINSSFNIIIGSYFGTDITGTVSVPNDVGIRVSGINNNIGGSLPGEGNVISGNEGDGVIMKNVAGLNFKGNLVGVDKTGNVALSNGENGITLSGASNSYIGGILAGERNIISSNICRGVMVDDASTFVRIKGNYIGTDSTGNLNLGNFGKGVDIENGSGNIELGDENGEGRNIISGTNGYTSNLPLQCRDAVSPATSTMSGNAVEITGNLGLPISLKNNYIGVNISGNTGITNGGTGVLISNSSNVNVGNSGVNQKNIISGNNNGIQISGSSSLVAVKGNYIGTNATGTASISNNSGIIAFGTANNNTIGGGNSGDGNLISGNANAGISFAQDSPNNFDVKGNTIGLNSAGTTALPNFTGIEVLGSANNN